MTDKVIKSMLLFMLVVIIASWSFLLGADAGVKRACSSIKGEWVDDKCMKVTREEVK